MLLSKPVETGGWRIAYLSPNMPGVRVPLATSIPSYYYDRSRPASSSSRAPPPPTTPHRGDASSTSRLSGSQVSGRQQTLSKACMNDAITSRSCAEADATAAYSAPTETPSEQLLVPVATPALCTARSRASWYFIPPPYIGGEPVTGGTQNARHAPA
ncbi:hypothetical protein B0H14DRAFT_3491405 [Mycena olivaceomarginata]|nr:hypothetical protein B0H14DRAFT_3491405 [Mycena olivaceomarginata]